MKNKRMGLFALVLVTLVTFGGLVSAYGTDLDNSERELHREQMEEIIEYGNYEDLVAFREEIGREVIPWVLDEEGFEILQTKHQYMVENGIEHHRGMMKGKGQKFGQWARNGECPNQ